MQKPRLRRGFVLECPALSQSVSHHWTPACLLLSIHSEVQRRRIGVPVIFEASPPALGVFGFSLGTYVDH